MTEFVFCEKLREIYAVFGKPYPPKHVSDSIFRRVSSFPDGFMDYALTKIENQTDLPRNIGLYLCSDVWPEYRSKNPQVQARVYACRDCAPEMPGFFWAWDSTGYRMVCKCACNQDKRFESIQPWTRKQAQESGLLLADPTATESEPQYLPPSAKKAIGHTEAPRRDHIAQREYSDADVW